MDPAMMSGITGQQPGAGQFMQKVGTHQQAIAASAVGHGVQGGVGMGYSMYTSGYMASAVPSTAAASSATAATEIPSSAMAVAKSQLHSPVQSQIAARAGQQAHVATAIVQTAISVSVNAPPAASHRPLNGLISPASQPLSSPSETSSSVSTSGLTLSLAQLQATGAHGHSSGLQNDTLHSVGASATPPGSQGATGSPRVTGLQMQIPSVSNGGKDPSTLHGFHGADVQQQPDSEMMTQLSLTKDFPLTLAQQQDPTSLSLAQQQKLAAAAAATTQAEIEEKTRQLQDLLARRMSQDPNFLANLRPGDPLQIIKSIMQGNGGANSGEHRRRSSNGGATAMEDDDSEIHPHSTSTLPAEEWEEHARGHAHQQQQRRMKYQQMQEKQSALQAQMAQHLLPADAPIHAALSVPMKSRALSATNKRTAAALAQAAAMQAGDPASLPFPPKARGSSAGGKPARAPKTAAAGVMAGSPASGEQKRIYRRKVFTPPSPYQRLDGEAADKERARRMSPVTQYEYGPQAVSYHVISRGANSAPSSQRTSPALKPSSRIHNGAEDEMTMMHDYDTSPDAAMSPSSRSVMSPSDPNYHRWLAKRQQVAGDSPSGEDAQIALHHSNSYNQRLLQAHKLLMEQSQRARESRSGDRHGHDEGSSAREASRRAEKDYGGYEYSQSVPPPSMTVDVGSRYPNHSTSAYPQTPNQHGLFSPPSHGGGNGGLFSPPAHTSNYSPRQQSQAHHLNPLFSPLPSSTPSGSAHSGLSIGLHHASDAHHPYLMSSPLPSGGSGMDGSMQGQPDGYGSSSAMQHGTYGASGFNLPTPMETSRGVSSILASGTTSPSITSGQSNSFLFTPLPPQTPSVFMNLSSHATTGSGLQGGTSNGGGAGQNGAQAQSGNVTMQGNETPLPAGASTNLANYGTQFDWGHTATRASPPNASTMNTSSVSTPPPVLPGASPTPSRVSSLHLSLPAVSPSPHSLLHHPSSFTMSPHVRGSDILGMLSPGGVNGLSAMPVSPMMETALPMLPTAHDIAS